MNTRCLLLLGTLGVAGCAGTAPFHFAETAQVLRPGQVSITAAGGLGKAEDSDGYVGGGGLRVRGGLGGHSELGVEGTALTSDNRKVIGGGAKLSFKGAVTPWMAVLLGGGVGIGRYQVTGGITRDLLPLYAGGDLGLVFSPYRPLLRVLRPYLGLRAGLGADVGDLNLDSQLRTAHLVFSPTAAGGLSVEPASWLHVLLEGGYLGALYHNRNDSPSSKYYNAGYGALALAFLLGGS